MEWYRRCFEATVWALAAIGAISFGAFLLEVIGRDGGIAYDFHAYILAGRHALDGSELYGMMQIGDPGAFRYPPFFAYLAIPLALPPELAVTWLYRAVCLACVRYLTGSWRATGVALLFYPVQIELVALNVTLPLAASVRATLRGSAVNAALTPVMAALKYGTIFVAGYAWLIAPRQRRWLAFGVALVVIAILIDAFLHPGQLTDYLGSLRQQAGSANQAPFVGSQLLVIVPSTLWDFVLRLALCAAATVVAIRRRWAWLAFAAAALAVPTLWVARLAALVGVPRLWWEDRAPRGGDARARRA